MIGHYAHIWLGILLIFHHILEFDQNNTYTKLFQNLMKMIQVYS